MVKYQHYTLRNVLVIVEQPIYRVGDKGEDFCMLGSTISNRGDCETACESSDLEIGGTLKDGNRCYQAGNGKCRQDGREGSGASLICESKLYNIILLYLSVDIEGHKYRISQHFLWFILSLSGWWECWR